MNNHLDASSDDSNSKPCSQGVRPKVRHHYHKGSKSKEAQNGCASQCEKINSVQNGASCSYQNGASCSSSSSSSSLNKLLSDSFDKSKVDNSSEKCSAKGRTLPSEENDVRNHDKKRKTRNFIDDDSSSGNDGDGGLSGDDCCIYTYKGDQFADLPNSFFPVDMVNEAQPPGEDHREAADRRELQVEENERSNLGSSPEMDYLEMDFDPGPSVEQDSEEDFDGFDRKPDSVSPVPELPSENMIVDDKLNGGSDKMEMSQDSQDPQPGTSGQGLCSPKKDNVLESDCNSNNYSRTKEFLGDCYTGFCTVGGNNQNGGFPNQNVEEEAKPEDASGNDINSYAFPGKRLEKKTLLTEKNDLCISMDNVNDGSSKSPFDGIMLWTEQEAISKQVTLVSSEMSCGATAVINVMLVLKMRISVEKVKEGITTRLRSESASIPQYLVSRSFAGVGQENLIRGIHHASQGALYARFFQMHPRRDIVLSRWLSHWMQKGAVPIATMNVQRDAASDDSTTLGTRHHQMIFGASSKGIYLTNPLECLQDEELWRRLNSPSVLKVKRSEIVSRWSPGTDLKPLMFQTDDRWKKMNVLGQVVNIIRESPDPEAQGKFLTQHISIPASSGITLVIPRESSGYEELVSAPDLPLSST